MKWWVLGNLLSVQLHLCSFNSFQGCILVKKKEIRDATLLPLLVFPFHEIKASILFQALLLGNLEYDTLCHTPQPCFPRGISGTGST
uniref:Secreted protein n=1 Tax=Macaca nemestrina TaxID=9545 RepID=A0A2K6D0Q0_MACNE